MEEWIPDSTVNKGSREYLNDHVWNKRRQWALCYFKNAFTMAYSTTHRIESFHAIIKSITSNTDIISLYKDLKSLWLRQSKQEEKMKNGFELVRSLKTFSTVMDTFISELFIRMHISSFGAQEICKQISKALRMKTEKIIFEEVNNCFKLSSNTRYVYYDKTEKDSMEPNVSVTISLEREKENISCECDFTSRMKFSCRHSLSLAFQFDKDYKIGNCQNAVDNILKIITQW